MVGQSCSRAGGDLDYLTVWDPLPAGEEERINGASSNPRSGRRYMSLPRGAAVPRMMHDREQMQRALLKLQAFDRTDPSASCTATITWAIFTSTPTAPPARSTGNPSAKGRGRTTSLISSSRRWTSSTDAMGQGAAQLFSRATCGSWRADNARLRRGACVISAGKSSMACTSGWSTRSRCKRK